jgi:hypothetical protein
MKTISISAGEVTSREKINPKGKGIPHHHEKALFSNCHIVVIVVKII